MTRKINLPDIDENAPNVYESEGQLIETVLYHSDDESVKESPNEDIITESISIKKDRFRTTPTESFQDRYQRLLSETQELLVDIRQEEKIDLQDQVEELLSNLKLMKKQAYYSKLEYIPKTSTGLHQLANQITSFKQSTNTEMVYELKYSAGLSSTESKNLELEHRITNLERLIGADVQKSYGETVQIALERLDKQVSLLTQPNVFEQTVRRIQESSMHLERLVDLRKKLKIELGLHRNDKVPTSELATQDEKIQVLYQQLVKLDSVSSMIPHIVSRLKALQSIHNDSVRFQETLEVLKEDQDHLKYLAKETQVGMKQLLDSVLENQSKIQKNIEALDKRMSEFMQNK
jgi:hypothetical protein